MIDTYFFDNSEKEYSTIDKKDEDIWSTFPNTTKEHIVIVASKR